MLAPKPRPLAENPMAENVSLEFVARQLDRVLTRLGAIEDQITVLTGMAIRHDGALTGLATEFRGLAQSLNHTGLLRSSHIVNFIEVL